MVLIRITDLKRVNIYLHFSDFEFLNPPRPSKVPFLLDDFKNTIDHLRIRDFLLEENFDLSSFPSVVNVPKSVFAALPKSRNLFEILKPFPAIPLALEKKTKADNQVDSELIAWASEQPPSLNVAEPKINSCCKLAAGPTSERNKEKKANLITIKSNFNSAAEDLLREKKG